MEPHISRVRWMLAASLPLTREAVRLRAIFVGPHALVCMGRRQPFESDFEISASWDAVAALAKTGAEPPTATQDTKMAAGTERVIVCAMKPPIFFSIIRQCGFAHRRLAGRGCMPRIVCDLCSPVALTLLIPRARNAAHSRFMRSS
jgi:hypothetical protein